MKPESDTRVGVFICSSDNRRDILDRVLPSILKFWADCPYPIYVGLNSPIDGAPVIRSLLASPSGWRGEVLQQISHLTETHLIVILDDFLFQGNVDQSRLSMLVAKARDLNLKYLRLLPLGRSLRQRLTPEEIAAPEADIREIRIRRPFYSGLQIAIWEREHFAALLRLRGSIWEFEHQQIFGVAHHVIASNPPIIYRHLVEKGQWLPYAKSLLSLAGLSNDLGSRLVWPKWRNLRLAFDEARLFVLGYANH